MKPSLLLLASVALTVVSCSTAKKKEVDVGVSGVRDLLIVAEPVPTSTIESLKAIANDPAYLLPAESQSDDSTETAEPAIAEATLAVQPDSSLDLRKKWKRPGIDPGEVNPGDVFFENAGPVLHKTLSLADELSPNARKLFLDQYSISKTTRVPVTISKAELAVLKDEMPGNYQLPTRSVALDYHSEQRTLQGEPYLKLLEALENGESGGAVESAERRARLKKQLATMKNQLKSGDRLFVVTGVVETEKLRATYPGAPLGALDAELIRNTIAGLYPHLISLEAEKSGDAIELTAPPRILWEFDTREIKIEGGKLVIDFDSVVQL